MNNNLNYYKEGGFNPSSLFYTDGYKLGHGDMLAPNTEFLYGQAIPRSFKHLPFVKRCVSMGQQFTWIWIHDEFQRGFFAQPLEKALKFAQDMSFYLGIKKFDSERLEKLYKLGYLPIRAKSLPEGITTKNNIPHMTFVNTVKGFAWLTLYLETICSAIYWRFPTSATKTFYFKKNIIDYTNKTDNTFSFIDFLAHDFSARGLDPFTMISSGLGFSSCSLGSDNLIVIPAARYYYNESENSMPVFSVKASEHSVSCTNIFYYKKKLENGELNDEIKNYYSFDLPCDGDINNPDYLAIAEYLMLKRWLSDFPEGILSYVSDTFNTWKAITHIISRLKSEILTRNGKLVVRGDSGDPVDIICGLNSKSISNRPNVQNKAEYKGMIELLWDIFGGIINEQGYKVLDSHIGAIYGDGIGLDTQLNIYERLKSKNFACTNIVLGVGSYYLGMNSRDSLGVAIKGGWFQTEDNGKIESYNIYKNPITDNGVKKSPKGLLRVDLIDNEYVLKEECTEEEEKGGLLQIIYEDGKFYNQTTLTEIRKKVNAELKNRINEF